MSLEHLLQTAANFAAKDRLAQSGQPEIELIRPVGLRKNLDRHAAVFDKKQREGERLDGPGVAKECAGWVLGPKKGIEFAAVKAGRKHVDARHQGQIAVVQNGKRHPIRVAVQHQNGRVILTAGWCRLNAAQADICTVADYQPVADLILCSCYTAQKRKNRSKNQVPHSVSLSAGAA